MDLEFYIENCIIPQYAAFDDAHNIEHVTRVIDVSLQLAEEYGVNPENLIDIKALQGDTSDNIPGVKGIGEKTAHELVQKFHNLDYIYENIDSIDIKESVRKKLITDKSNAYLSYKLGKIDKKESIK